MNCYRLSSNTIDYRLYRLIAPGLRRQRQLSKNTSDAMQDYLDDWGNHKRLERTEFFNPFKPLYVQILQADLHTLLKRITVFIRISAHPNGRKS